MSFVARQGDVLVRQIPSIPTAVTRVGNGLGFSILSQSSFTGNDHRIPGGTAIFYADAFDPESYPPQRKYLSVEIDDAQILHPEHAAIPIPRGVYEVINQRELGPEGSRNVAD